MHRQEGCAGWRAATVASAVFAIGLFSGSLDAKAQQAPEAPTETVAEPSAALEEASADDAAPAAVEGALSDEELQALVAPIALYPDLVLVLTLQASLAPLDIVQGQRFLARYAEDPSLEPDPDWDESVIGLLNYPSVVQRMSDDLDWTETLGAAVLDQLEGVQDAIQEIRGFMRAVGALESNDKVTVIVEDEIIRLEPVDENAVFIPQYDPEALLAALYSTAPPEPEAAAQAGAEASTETAPSEAGAEAGQGEVVPGEEAPATEQAESMVESEPAPVAEAVPAAAPVYYPPPPMTYSDPSPSWLGTAATFAGGAAVGGLVGWAIADDDDDDDDDGDYSRGNVSIEDSNIVVNRGDGRGDDLDDLQRRAQDERLERAARERAQREQAKLKLENERLKRDAQQTEQRAQTKRELEQRYAGRQPREAQARGSSQRKAAGLSTSGSRQPVAATRSPAGDRQLAARVDQAKSPPGGREATRARPAKSAKAARPGDRRQPQVASAFGGQKSAVQARRDSDRGLKSRSRAKAEVKPHRSRGGGSAFAQHGGGGGKARGGGRGKRGRGRG